MIQRGDGMFGFYPYLTFSTTRTAEVSGVCSLTALYCQGNSLVFISVRA
jgi:hypothetical protein